MLRKLKIATLPQRMKSTAKTKPTVLVTGGGGYIGAVLTEELVKTGFDVRVLDTFYWGKESLDHLKGKIKIIQGDIRDIKGQILKGVFAVAHIAGLSNDPMAEFAPKANFEINTKATIRLAKLCRAQGVRKFIFASSASIYYNGITSNPKIQDEESPVSPKAAYSLSKRLAEVGLLKLKSKSFCPIIFRQGTVFGYSPKMRYDLVVNTMLKDALFKNKIAITGGGSQFRPLIDVIDIARAYIVALKAPEEKVSGQIFNLAYDNYKISDLARLVKSTIEKNLKVKIKLEIANSFKKDRSYRISTEKIKKTLLWQPSISVEESVATMISKLKNQEANYAHPKFYNIEWMKLLLDLHCTFKGLKKIF